MIISDDRTEETRKTHNRLVTATDKCMSNWGHARAGASKCAWCCKPEHFYKILDWVNSRKEMLYVNVNDNGWRPRNAAHVHYYVVDETHPALN